MNYTLKSLNQQSALIRLTALWALNEAAIGGLLHMFRTPFSGLILASNAVMLMALIAYVADKPAKEILKALTIVLIIKLTLSPHSPITAYVAVSFQGLAGALLFGVLPFRVAAILLGIVSLLESAMQKLLVLTLIFGKSLWDSLSLFIEHVGKKVGYENIQEGELLVVFGYVGLYACVGLVVGILIGRLPQQLDVLMSTLKLPATETIGQDVRLVRSKKSVWRSKKVRLFVMVSAIILVVYFAFPEAQAILRPAYILLRVIAVLFIWFVIVSPFLMKLLQRFVNNKASTYRADVDASLALIPSFKVLVKQAWSHSSSFRGLKRMRIFVLTALSYCLLYNLE